MKKIIVVVITGFLGAGKTTFLNKLIQKHNALKLIIVENEFGTVPIDNELISGVAVREVVDLNSGCICCTISNEFALSLLEIADRAGDADFLIIETSGVADLSNVIRPFLSDELLAEHFVYEGSICLVDACNFDRQMKGREQQHQVIFSDCLLLNKSGGFDDEQLCEMERRLKAYNNTARIIRTDHGNTENFDLRSFSVETQNRMVEVLSKPVIFRSVESSKYTTYTHQFQGQVNIKKFKSWFNYFAAINQREIYRIKGILYPDDQTDRVVVQSVGGVVSYQSGPAIQPSDVCLNTLVFIGKAVETNYIVAELENYM